MDSPTLQFKPSLTPILKEILVASCQFFKIIILKYQTPHNLTPTPFQRGKPIQYLAWTFSNVFRYSPWSLEEEQLAMCRKAVTVFFHKHADNKELQGVYYNSHSLRSQIDGA